jgi:hypothetical protein
MKNKTIVAIIVLLGVVILAYLATEKYKKIDTSSPLSPESVMSTEIDIKDLLGVQKNWYHMYEQDDADVLVYRNFKDNEEIPPARFREAISFKNGNICNQLQLSPDDGHYMKEVSCSYEKTKPSGVYVFKINGALYKVISHDSEEIRLKRLMPDFTD